MSNDTFGSDTLYVHTDPDSLPSFAVNWKLVIGFMSLRKGGALSCTVHVPSIHTAKLEYVAA